MFLLDVRIQTIKKLSLFSASLASKSGVFARCTHRANKKARTLKVRATLTKMVFLLDVRIEQIKKLAL